MKKNVDDPPLDGVRDKREFTLDPVGRDPLVHLRSHHEPVARAAFEVLYRDYYALAWKFAHRFVGQRDIAQDIAQDVFFSVWDRRATLRIHSTIRAYLLGAVRLHALKFIRNSTNEQTLTRQAGPGVTPTSVPPAGMGGVFAAPDQIAETALLVERINHVLCQLPERQRSAFLLRWEQGLNNREIAQALGIGEAAASRLLTRAAEALRRVM